jgi:hypothetical protein
LIKIGDWRGSRILLRMEKFARALSDSEVIHRQFSLVLYDASTALDSWAWIGAVVGLHLQQTSSERLKQEREFDVQPSNVVLIDDGSDDRQFAESFLEFAHRNFREQTFSDVVSEKRLPTRARPPNSLQWKAIGRFNAKAKGVTLGSIGPYKEIRRLRSDAY